MRPSFLSRIPDRHTQSVAPKFYECGESPVRESRKRAISLRVSITDLRKLKLLAQRLGVRDSDVIRFAVKSLLRRLEPLCDQSLHGRALLPVFIEEGSEFFHHFELDGARLEEIVNEGVTKDQEVAADDLKLIAMAGLEQAYASLAVPPRTALSMDDTHPSVRDPLRGKLRGYLYSKYVAQKSVTDAAND